jgi:hypothetical protein
LQGFCKKTGSIMQKWQDYGDDGGAQTAQTPRGLGGLPKKYGPKTEKFPKKM